MEGYILEWITLLLRWSHIIVGIAWIGASFYFVWLDNHLAKPESADLQEKGVDGELWAVHGGGFYNPQKYMTAPRHLPQNLHWFYWESYSTWMTGIALFIAMYLYNAQTYLLDPQVFAMSVPVGITAALLYLVLGWIVYDRICRIFGRNDRMVGIAVSVYIVVATYVACRLFAGRAAFLLTGGMMATIMTANVFFWIIPGQKNVIAAMTAGSPVNPDDGARAKQRSVHNTYFTLPVLFAMLSNHFNMLYSFKYNWAVLVLMMASGALIREFFIIKHKDIINPWYVVVPCLIIVGVAIWVAPASSGYPGAGSHAHGPVSYQRIEKIMKDRCVACHAAKPTMVPIPPKNILLDSEKEVLRHARLIFQQCVTTKVMPLGNITKMTEEERAVIKQWFQERLQSPKR